MSGTLAEGTIRLGSDYHIWPMLYFILSLGMVSALDHRIIRRPTIYRLNVVSPTPTLGSSTCDDMSRWCLPFRGNWFLLLTVFHAQTILSLSSIYVLRLCDQYFYLFTNIIGGDEIVRILMFISRLKSSAVIYFFECVAFPVSSI